MKITKEQIMYAHGPYEYKPSGMMIMANDGQLHVADIRGWGFLSCNASKLTDDEAARLMDFVGYRMAAVWEMHQALKVCRDAINHFCPVIKNNPPTESEMIAMDAMIYILKALKKAEGAK